MAGPRMTELAYMREPWFALLLAAIAASDQSAVARAIGRSPSLVNQVIKGSGAYGSGAASTAAIARRVLDVFGQWACPFLSDDVSGDASAQRVITSAQCRTYAHRDAPTGSPRDLAHWRACRTCPNRARSAPPAHRPVMQRPRKGTETPTPHEEPTP